MKFWNHHTETQFFIEELKKLTSPQQLFYKLKNGYFAYVPKGTEAEGQTLQGRNTLIGSFTEKWAKKILTPIARKLGLHAINNVVCNELGLSKKSSADIAFCTTDAVTQKAENIKLLFEVKMSILANYKFTPTNQLDYIGDYKQHKGIPSLLRSDSMLKAIGKAINIRLANAKSNKIPIVILGNSPITAHYIHKIDRLKTSGVIQGCWSLNPQPSRTTFIENTPNLGFQTISNNQQLFQNCKELIQNDMNYFSSMMTKEKLGKIIHLAAQEGNHKLTAEKFLTLLQN